MKRPNCGADDLGKEMVVQIPMLVLVSALLDLKRQCLPLNCFCYSLAHPCILGLTHLA